MQASELRRLRLASFARSLPLDEGLRQTCRAYPSHSFLVNPAGQNVYLYLTEYLALVAPAWFGRPLEQLRMLDWGCGKGQVSYLLEGRGVHTVLADVADDQAGDSALGQQVPLLRALGRPVQPLEHPYLLPFESESFEVVLSFGVLEHVPRERESLREIRRVLCPGGLFFCFNLPYRGSWVMRTAHLLGNHYHDRLYGMNSTRLMVSEAGLQVLDIWRRQLFPKNRIVYPGYRGWERLDQWLVDHTPLGYLATSLEFVATAV